MSTSVVNNNNLPDIPKEWNLTDEQRANMVAAQKKTIDEDNNKKIIQQKELEQIRQHASMNPPEYPILVLFKDNNVSSYQKQLIKYNKNLSYNKKYYLKDSNQNYIYASSFNDATNKVKNELSNSNSNISKLLKTGKDVIRISGDSKSTTPFMDDFVLIPNSNYKYWEIITTNAPLSTFTRFKNMFSSKGKGGKRTKKSQNKKVKKTKNKSKKNKKSKRKM
jgi:hypothetical protein